MHIPDDLANYDLHISVITKIVKVRELKRKAQSVITPSESRVALAKARIAWADEAETALKNGQEPKPYPKRNTKPEEDEE